jgi:hypothetical protein
MAIREPQPVQGQKLPEKVVDIQLDEPLSEDPGKHPHYYNRVFVT